MYQPKWWTALTIAVVALLAVSCSPPQEAIDGARASLTAADSVEAARYAPEAWQAAEQAMQAVDAELATQAGKFALFRSYGRTEELIAVAEEQAAAAEEAANAGREQAREAAQAALTGATAALDSAQAQLDALQQCKRKPKGFAADVEKLTGMLAGLRAQLPGIEAAVGSGDFLGAQSAAEALLAEANGLVTEFTDARTRLGC